ncbi:transcriptional regulator NrdR [uncultured Ruminococcus sp.]|mgnify:CR=1 FL=1|uniref:transcriptional regulator NrdR n=1 Tax=uncultured Ruminococcus sp. TaxID=165186 RepID=UPI00261EAEA0|nr:transcriptional regulator NrdR [uncultured Ruminococcus sp.]
MHCPFCGERDTRVLDSRPSETKIRRRRECTRCGKRFTTYEVVERPLLMVQKKDGSFEAFDRNKLITGIFNAIKKRPVSMEQVSAMIDQLENQYANEMRSTVTSSEIGNMVMEMLKQIDAVAYVRFASVYQDFTDVAGFIAVIGALDQS